MPERILTLVMDRQNCHRPAYRLQLGADARDNTGEYSLSTIKLPKTDNMTNGNGCESECMTADARADVTTDARERI